MHLSRKTDYALRVLFFLAQRGSVAPVAIQELADRNDIPKRFLEHIMLELKANGWVDSRKGKGGGYVLTKNPDRLTLGEIVRHFEGVLAPIGCVSVTGYEPCSQEPTCLFRRAFREIRDLTATLLDRVTVADIIAGRPLAIPPVER